MRLHHDTMRLLKIDFVFFPLRRTKKSISSWIINRAVWVLKSFLKPFPIWRWLSLHHFLKNFWDARKYTYRSVVFSQSNICFLKIGIISVNFNSLRKSLCIVTCLFHISALCLQLMLEISFFLGFWLAKYCMNLLFYCQDCWFHSKFLLMLLLKIENILMPCLNNVVICFERFHCIMGIQLWINSCGSSSTSLLADTIWDSLGWTKDELG